MTEGISPTLGTFLDHSGSPPEDVAARVMGWRRVHFEPLRKHLDAGTEPQHR